MSFEVLQYPRDGQLLRREARPVRDDEFSTVAVLAFVQELGTTMMDAGGIGLAAAQVREAPGGQPWACFAIRSGDDPRGAWGVVCNPEITLAEDEQPGLEGCLSFASAAETMRAPTFVTVKGRNAHSQPFELVLEGELARCAWHETQHLQGKLIDRPMSPMKRGLFLKAVAKARRSR
jgi:peptide deformylase